MSSKDKDHPPSEDTRLAESKTRADIYAAARDSTAQRGAQSQRDPQVSEHDRSRFAVILNQLDQRSRTSNRWLTALSLLYVAAVLFVVTVLYMRYSEVERMVDLLEKDLGETKEAIVEQGRIHRQQSDELLARIVSHGLVLDGMSNEREALETQLEEGGERADELRQEADSLKAKITAIDGLLEDLSKRAEPYHSYYAVDPDSPQRFGQGKGLDVRFGIPKSETLPAAPEASGSKGRFRVPAGGIYMVSGWFSTTEEGDPSGATHAVETEIRIDEIPRWSGFSLGNGSFTSAVSVRAGQFLSIHTTIRSTDGEAEPPSGSIDRGEIRIERVYHAPE